MLRHVIANWKMNLNERESERLAAATLAGIGPAVRGLSVAVCPSYVAIPAVRRVTEGTILGLGAQDVSAEPNGAHTGEVSMRMLTEQGVKYVIVGHSERRRELGESDELVRAKLRAVMRSLAMPVLCLGETGAELKAGKRDEVIERHLESALKGLKPKRSERLVVAYEPIWAIGTGRVCDPEEAERAHAHVRKIASGFLGKEWSRLNLAVIYGGSVNEKNVRGFVVREGIDGVLVGGASLKAGGFSRIVREFASGGKRGV